MHSCFLFACADYSNLAAQEIIGGPRMSYGSIDAGSFGSRNPFGGPTRQGYQPVGKDTFFSCPQPGVLSIYHQALLEKKKNIINHMTERKILVPPHLLKHGIMHLFLLHKSSWD